jgi:hypothetical protein
MLSPAILITAQYEHRARIAEAERARRHMELVRAAKAQRKQEKDDCVEARQWTQILRRTPEPCFA